MLKILLLVSTFCFSQELKVEGDLNVTGNILNSKIDSLEQVITNLQSQLSLNNLKSKIVTIENIPIGDGDHYNYIYLDSLVGSHHDWYQFHVVDMNYNLVTPYNGTAPAVEARAYPDIDGDGVINNTFSPDGEFMSLILTQFGVQFVPQYSHTFNLAGQNPAFRFQNNDNFISSYGEGNSFTITLLIFYDE